MNSYEAKQAERRERIKQAADKKRAAAAAAFDSARRVADGIPFGQPILVGHHSEKRARRDAERIRAGMDRGVALSDEADRLVDAAGAVGTGGVSSDDPDAVEKLKVELATLERRQAQMRGDNLGARKAGVKKLHPAYKLTNNGANIRRIKTRIAELESKALDVTTERTLGDVRIVDSVEENRVQIFFPEKPSEARRRALRMCGFVWSPTSGAWQRKRAIGATYAAERAVLAQVES